jgi:predicted exporter
VSWRAKLPPALWLFTTALLVLYLLFKLPGTAWNSNITAAMPGTAAPWQQQLLQQNQSSRHLSLMLSGMPLAELRAAAAALQQQPLNQLHWLQPGKMLQQLQQQYQQHQALLASPAALQQLQTGQYQALVDTAWQRLLSPAPLLHGALQQDPLLLTQQFIEQQPQISALQPRQAWFETATGSTDQPVILLYANLSIDPFDRSAAGALALALQQQLQQLQQQWPALQLARSGVLFHAVHAADNAAFEMQFYGTISLLAILLLLWLNFSSIKPLLLALAVLSCATLSGLAAVLWLIPQPHVLALVFATTLIGIAIDYSFHGMLAANQGRRYFRAMLPSLALGLLTTLLGYFTLAVLPFALLNQVAIFMCAGLIAAFISVWLLFPLCIAPHSLKVNQRVLRWCAAISQAYAALPRHIVLRCALVSLLLLAGLLSQLRFADDVRLFNQSPATLLAEEQQVRTLGKQQWDSRFIVVLADTAQQVLQRETALQPLLQQWQQQGWLTGWQALSQQLPPQQQQDLLQQQLQRAYQSDPVQHYLAQLQLAPPPAITQRLLPDNFVSPLRQQMLPLAEEFAGVILLSGVAVPQQALAELTAMPQVYWLDPIADTNKVLAQLRQQLSQWLLLALAVTMLILLWRRGVAAACGITLMLVLAVGGALLLSQLLQQQLNIFNLVAALLVLALALDYGVFFTAGLDRVGVYQAVMLSALTSCLAFGLLSFSQTPAVAGFGFTVFSGVALAALLAPLLTVVGVKESKSCGTL